jgi:hypothetical protein
MREECGAGAVVTPPKFLKFLHFGGWEAEGETVEVLMTKELVTAPAFRRIPVEAFVEKVQRLP